MLFAESPNKPVSRFNQLGAGCDMSDFFGFSVLENGQISIKKISISSSLAKLQMAATGHVLAAEFSELAVSKLPDLVREVAHCYQSGIDWFNRELASNSQLPTGFGSANYFAGQHFDNQSIQVQITDLGQVSSDISQLYGNQYGLSKLPEPLLASQGALDRYFADFKNKVCSLQDALAKMSATATVGQASCRVNILGFLLAVSFGPYSLTVDPAKGLHNQPSQLAEDFLAAFQTAKTRVSESVTELLAGEPR